MRVTNDVKSYIKKEVWDKADGKYESLKADVVRIKNELKDEYDKFYNEQEKILADVSRRLAALAKKHGLTLKDNRRFAKGFSEWDFVERDHHPEPLASAERAVNNFIDNVDHAIHYIIFKLAGSDCFVTATAVFQHQTSDIDIGGAI